jgi:phosphoribosyl 1,2-cyclic phosphate phosphodiesterase
MRVTILGCGSSSGVPMIGNRWGKCDPAEPRNRRLRSSILVESDAKSILVDTSPDLREQLLRVNHDGLVDAVLFTHAHADHLHGIDELRWVNVATDNWLDIHADRTTLDEIGARFGYVFEQQVRDRPFYKPCLKAHEIGPGYFDAAGIRIGAFEQDHGFSRTMGFRIGGFGYSTDCVDLDDRAFEMLAGIDLWIVDCFRMTEHSTHAWFDRTMSWIDRLRPGRAVLTHMGPDMDYGTLRDLCPAGVEPAYDGMILEIDG